MAVTENTLLSSIQVDQAFDNKRMHKAIVKDMERLNATQITDNTAIDARVTSVESTIDSDYTRSFLLGGM